MWYFLFFVIIAVLCILKAPETRLKFVFSLVVLALSALSFFVAPSESWDLFRHYETIELYGDQGLDWVIAFRLDQNPLTALYLYSFSFLSDTRFFAFVTILITYGFTFLLLYEAKKDYNLNRNSVAWLSFYLLSNWNYLLVTSNCRIFMLYAIVAYFFYMELVRDRHHVIAPIVYVASCFFHYGIVIVLVARFVLYLQSFVKNSVMLTFILFLFIATYSYLLPMLSSYSLVETIESKIESYQAYNVFGTLQYASSLANIILVAFIFALTKMKDIVNTKFTTVSIFTLLIIATQITNYQIIIRETCIVSSFAIVPLIAIICEKKHQTIISAVKFESIIMLAYRCWYEYTVLDYNFVI